MAGDGAAPPDDAPVVLVRGPSKGRWRIGRRFGPEPTTIPISELGWDDLEALRTDPELTVQAS